MGISEKIVTNAQNEVVQHEVVDAPQDSIEFSVNAKGEPSFTVKAYGKDAADVEQRLQALLLTATKNVAALRVAKGA